MTHSSSLSIVLQDSELTCDVVTGALAPSVFRRAIAAWTDERATRQLPSSSVLLIQVDWHEEHSRHDGADALRTVAELLGRHTRSSDVVGRVDADTIGILMPTTPVLQAELLSRRILATIAGRTAGSEHPITVSIGIASALDDAPVRRATAALADARGMGGDHAVVAAEEPREFLRRAA